MSSGASTPEPNRPQNRIQALSAVFLGLVVLLLLAGALYAWKSAPPSGNMAGTPEIADQQSVAASTSPLASPSVVASHLAGMASGLDLSVGPDGLSRSTIDIQTAKGLIKLKLYSNDAPVTAHRFVELVQNGFYNGLTFHRAEPDFVIQGGDPQGNGRGGSGTKLKAEFNSRHHIEGTVAMARTNDPNSADSQFYIALKPLPQLDGNYTVFGQVVEGLDVIHKIQAGDKMISLRVE
jgi:cyclophilin family peptidyl-prolyl cis-trans isomerase